MYNFKEVSLSKVGIPIKIVGGCCHTFLIVRTKICRKCGCGFNPTRLSDLMLMNTNIPELPIDMICNIIRVGNTISAEPNCSQGGHCYC